MSYAALSATRIATACRRTLVGLRPDASSPEVYERKRVMIERLGALAAAAAESADGGQVTTLTSEEFSLISHEWPQT